MLYLFTDADDTLELNKILRHLKREKNNFIKSVRTLYQYHIESEYDSIIGLAGWKIVAVFLM